MTLILYILDNLPVSLLIALLLALAGGAALRGKWYGFVIIALFVASLFGNLMAPKVNFEQIVWYVFSVFLAMLVVWITRPRSMPDRD